MKILLIGEYSNVHATLVDGLRQLGHTATVVSNGDFWKDYPRDIDVSRPTGPFAGLRLLAKVYTLLPQFRGYDVVQLINPIFFELRPERLFRIYRYLRRHNRTVILGAFGMDWYWVKTCTVEKPLRYSDFNFGKTVRTDEAARKEQSEWLGTAKERLNKLIANDCDGIVTGLYEYDVCYRPLFPEKTQFIPYPIQAQHTAPLTDVHKPLRIFVGISKQRSAYKGTDIMLKAAEAVLAKYPDRMILQKAEGIPFDEYQHMMNSSDVILDQLYAYTPAMNALLAMSKGIVVMGGGEPENYEILGETEFRPIVNIEPNYDSVCHELEQLVLHPERIPALKRESIEYIKKHHDFKKVAMQYVDFWNR